MATSPGHKNLFYDEHSFDEQRVVAITCLLYGSDPAKYTPVMQKLKIPPSRLVRCKTDYAARKAAWMGMLHPYTRTELK